MALWAMFGSLGPFLLLLGDPGSTKCRKTLNPEPPKLKEDDDRSVAEHGIADGETLSIILSPVCSLGITWALGRNCRTGREGFHGLKCFFRPSSNLPQGPCSYIVYT